MRVGGGQASLTLAHSVRCLLIGRPSPVAAVRQFLIGPVSCRPPGMLGSRVSGRPTTNWSNHEIPPFTAFCVPPNSRSHSPTRGKGGQMSCGQPIVPQATGGQHGGGECEGTALTTQVIWFFFISFIYPGYVHVLANKS